MIITGSSNAVRFVINLTQEWGYNLSIDGSGTLDDQFLRSFFWKGKNEARKEEERR